MVFPCPSNTELFDPVELPTKGQLWSWTVQRFRPKSPPYTGPDAFTPYAVGYVELPGVVIVESRLVNIPFDQLRIGMDMKLTVETFGENTGGNPVLTYAFEPAAADTAGEESQSE